MSKGFFATLDRNLTCDLVPDGMNVMLPIASWWRIDVELRRPPRVPLHVGAVGVDTGSFALAQRYDGYPYGMNTERIVRWCRAVRPDWVVLPDWPMERLSTDERRAMQFRTTRQARSTIHHYWPEPWVWCPVVQGWTPTEYARHAVALADLIYGLQEHYRKRGLEKHFRVCIGSVCRRGETERIREIVALVAAILPGIPLHPLGMKLAALNGWTDRPDAVYSTDSGAFNRRFGSDLPRINADQRRRGMTQRQYTLQVCLPEYAEKVSKALAL